MSIRLMTYVFDEVTDLDSTAKLLLLAIADQASDNGECWPSVNTMARRIGRSPRRVQQLLKEFEDRGYIRRATRVRGSDGGQTSNVITVLLPPQGG
jgi:DNA-binding MarR family transcriptional regulator